MNYSIIAYIIGSILKLEAVFMLLPCITALIYQEQSGFAFLITMVICLIIGFLPLTLPARLMAPPYSKNFSVSVVLPASGCEIIAKVLLFSISFVYFDTVCLLQNVPGGVGSVTTSVLVGHVVEAAMRKTK